MICWSEASLIYLTRGLSTEHLQHGRLLHQSKQERGLARENALARMEVTIFCNLIMEVTSHNFCCLLFIRRKLLGPVHIQGQEILQVDEYQEAETIETMSEAI